MTSDESGEDFLKLAENCVAQEGAEDEDLEILFTRKIPTSRAGACIPACLFESLGIVSVIQLKPQTTHSNNKNSNFLNSLEF